MSDGAMKKVSEVMSHPMMTTATGAIMAALSQLSFNDIISEAAMIGGVITCGIGIGVQLRVWRVKGLEEEERRINILRGRIALEKDIKS